MPLYNPFKAHIVEKPKCYFIRKWTWFSFKYWDANIFQWEKAKQIIPKKDLKLWITNHNNHIEYLKKAKKERKQLSKTISIKNLE
jgi:hypothetical protein